MFQNLKFDISLHVSIVVFFSNLFNLSKACTDWIFLHTLFITSLRNVYLLLTFTDNKCFYTVFWLHLSFLSVSGIVNRTHTLINTSLISNNVNVYTSGNYIEKSIFFLFILIFSFNYWWCTVTKYIPMFSLFSSWNRFFSLEITTNSINPSTISLIKLMFLALCHWYNL